ncbi:hypothetical protein FV139_20605 [Parahaliea maris]|uniref:Transcriptional regulator SutA RNAP-binding domain-containing protein n=1 Tax=Parahaliea maris TaxID=2716870 RepID=A0A5C8ZMU2_9GAMM|nr:hypothetical protein [Parahaliea maris]TXS89082.1 hypothetical protein FV139_20605 [Parahaliea maris]
MNQPEKTRADIERDVAEYLAGGGRVTPVAPGVTGEDFSRHLTQAERRQKQKRRTTATMESRRAGK